MDMVLSVFQDIVSSTYGAPVTGYTLCKSFCCGQLWVWHMFCGKGSWWVIPPTKSMDRIETPLRFQSIVWTFVRHTVSRCLIFPSAPGSGQGHVGKFLPTGKHGLCFGYLFSGPLPLHSLKDGPPFGVSFRESLVVRLHSKIDQIHLGIEACLPLGDCHTF